VLQLQRRHIRRGFRCRRLQELQPGLLLDCDCEQVQRVFRGPGADDAGLNFLRAVPRGQVLARRGGAGVRPVRGGEVCAKEPRRELLQLRRGPLLSGRSEQLRWMPRRAGSACDGRYELHEVFSGPLH